MQEWHLVAIPINASLVKGGQRDQWMSSHPSCWWLPDFRISQMYKWCVFFQYIFIKRGKEK